MKVVEISEVEVVAGQHGRDATIQRLEMMPPRTRFRVRCRELSAHPDGAIYRDTRVTAWRMSYLSAYDAAEAWAWRGERPE